MESLDANQPDDDEQQRYHEVVPGWILLAHSETPEATVIRLARRDQPRRAWVTAMGPAFEEALTEGVQRIELFEAVDRHWQQRSGPS